MPLHRGMPMFQPQEPCPTCFPHACMWPGCCCGEGQLGSQNEWSGASLMSMQIKQQPGKGRDMRSCSPHSCASLLHQARRDRSRSSVTYLLVSLMPFCPRQVAHSSDQSHSADPSDRSNSCLPCLQLTFCSMYGDVGCCQSVQAIPAAAKWCIV